MQARGFRVTTAVLFSLEGALQDRPWRSFSAGEKDALLKKLARSNRRPDADARPVPQAAPKRISSSKDAPKNASTEELEEHR